jgi:hypothetical protein
MFYVFYFKKLFLYKQIKIIKKLKKLIYKKLKFIKTLHYHKNKTAYKFLFLSHHLVTGEFPGNQQCAIL